MCGVLRECPPEALAGSRMDVDAATNTKISPDCFSSILGLSGAL